MATIQISGLLVMWEDIQQQVTAAVDNLRKQAPVMQVLLLYSMTLTQQKRVNARCCVHSAASE